MWYVNLIYPYFIDFIVIYDRPKFSYKSKTLKVEISLDLMKWNTIHEGLIYTDESGLPLILPLSGLVKARYVRLSINEKHYFHLKKVSVFVKNDRLKLTENDSKIQYPLPSMVNKPLSIAILGTSNSIMNGYKEALQLSNCQIVKNVSVGSSHSSVIPYRLNQLNDIEADYLIVDIFVNEHRAYSLGYDFDNLTEEILQYLLSWCQTKKIIPILLIMPTNFTEDRKLLTRYLNWCEENHILYLNGFELINKLSKIWHRHYYSFFQDSAHLTPFIARTLGIVLNNCLINQSLIFSSPKIHLQYKNLHINDFHYIPLLDKINVENYQIQIVERKTSMVSENFIVLKENNKITLSFDKDYDIVGLTLNMAKSNACISIKSGKNILFKHLDNDYYDPNKDLWLVAWNFEKHIEVHQKQVTIECLGGINKESIVYEYNDHRNQSNSNLQKYEISIEIAGLIVRDKCSSQKSLIKVTGNELDLLNNFNFDIFKDL